MLNSFRRFICAGQAGALVLFSLLFNLPFVVFGVQRSAFDTDVHLFLADHYRWNWWSLWEPRWYLGFSMASYPPLVHQLIAILSWPFQALGGFFALAPEPYPGAFRLLSEEAAFVALTLLAVGLFPLALRALARVFVGPRAANIAAALAVVLPALSLSAWAFGQLPTILATTFALGALARGAAFAQRGRGRDLAQAALLAALLAATHHGTFLLLPFAGGAVVLRLAGTRQAPAILVRLALWVGCSALAVLLVLWPFLAWSHGQSLQAPIDHLSRHNLLTEPLAAWFFFWPVYGPLVLALPLAAWLGLRRPRLRPLLAALAGLFTLSLGGTTPLPRLLFGAGWEWLTYDRFGLWAAALLLPFAGEGALWLGRLGQAHRRLVTVGAATWAVVLVGWAAAAGWWSVINHSQPPAIDLAPLVNFLNAPAQSPYRYLTLGFGDQFAQLSSLTRNGSPDGDYHTARALPELRTSGLGALDAAVWNPQGAWAVLPFLRQAPRYGLRWVFVNHPFYIPVLQAAGWKFRFYVGSVGAWENAAVPSVPAWPPAGLEGSLAARWWGLAPLVALLLTGLAFAADQPRLTPARLLRGLATVRTVGFSATVILLSLWWVHLARPGTSTQVYFTYQSWLVFASDAALLSTLVAWAAERALRRAPPTLGPPSIAAAGLGLILAVALSAATSVDPALTVGLAVHLLLLAGLYLLCVNDPPSAVHLGWLLGGVLLAEATSAFWEVGLQSTAWLQGLALPWPGPLTPEVLGASVVGNAQGVRWLRAYGTLPHPNILGGMLLAYLGGVTARFLETGRRRWLVVLALGASALGLTFSRGAWLGAAAMAVGGGWLVRRASLVRRRAAVAGLVGLAALVATLLPLWPFLRERVNAGQDGLALEQRSIDERTSLLRVSLEIIRRYPVLGAGAGTFVEAVERLANPRLPLQPVHNVPVLIVAETGLPGALALLGLAAAMAHRLWRRRALASAAEAAWAGACLGLATAAAFDHFWWTLAPPRTLLVLVWALWVQAGQTRPAPPPAQLQRPGGAPAASAAWPSTSQGNGEAGPHAVGHTSQRASRRCSGVGRCSQRGENGSSTLRG